jgi:hypothetical protein
MNFLLSCLVLLPLVAPIILPSSSSTLHHFLPPLSSLCAINAELAPPVPVPSPDACAAICLAAAPQCVSFNLCKAEFPSSSAASTYAPSLYTCSANTFSTAYRPSTSACCSLFTKIRPRNDTKINQAVPCNCPHTSPTHRFAARAAFRRYVPAAPRHVPRRQVAS